MRHGWDAEFGGLVYGFDPEGALYDGDKYFWVQAESFAAAALLAVRTGESRYWDWYDRIWDYAWRHMVDHEHGAWFRILSRDNRKLGDESELRDAFDRIDTDRNGFISQSELRMAIISQNGMPAPGFSEAIADAQVQNMVKWADVDQDGRVSYAEYKRVIQAGCDPSGGRDHIRRHSGQAARIMSQQVTADESVIHL